MKIGEWYGEIPTGKGYFVYWFKIRKDGKNYYKIGTSTELTQRLNGKDYKEHCTRIEVLYVAQFSHEYEMANFEDINRSVMRQMMLDGELKGARWIKNDRFSYNHRLTRLPIYTRMDRPQFIEI